MEFINFMACRMSEVFQQHSPVLLSEAVTGLNISPNGIYIDATFGRGGHTQAILAQLSSSGRLIALDKDSEAVAYAKSHFVQDKRFTIYHQSFNTIYKLIQSLNLVEQIDGILFDLGISSPQLDNPQRGFSFLQDSKLDMRMDTTQGETAAQFIANVDEQVLTDILRQYGEERFARRISRAIIKTRTESPITNTKQLADIIAKSIPIHIRNKHPATRSFQAIRIAVNRELEELQSGLEQALKCLKIGGRLVVISFHSLEDRIVKQFIKQHEKGPSLPRRLPIKTQSDFNSRLKTIGKAIKPNEKEILKNPRARSGILRIAEKIS